MDTFVKKASIAVLGTFMALATFIMFDNTVLAESRDPSIKIDNIKTHSVNLHVTNKKFKNKNVKVRVHIKKAGSGDTYTTDYDVKINNKGKKRITIDGLDKDTEYTFYVKTHRLDGKEDRDFGSASNSKTIKTKN